MIGIESLLVPLILAAVIVFAALAFLFEISLFSMPPFVPAPASAMPSVAKALDLAPGMTLADLGCGDGRALQAALAVEPGIRAIGIDRHVFPLLLARLRLGRRVELRREDFFKTSLADIDRIYIYCWPSVLQRLLPRFEQELKPGARVFSADFRFEGREPSAVIELPGPQKRVRKLYAYDF